MYDKALYGEGPHASFALCFGTENLVWVRRKLTQRIKEVLRVINNNWSVLQPLLRLNIRGAAWFGTVSEAIVLTIKASM